MIRQCRITPSLSARFSPRFREIWDLEPYTDPESPAVFYGCYRPEDLKAVRQHRALALVVWCGFDARINVRPGLFRHLPLVRHVSTSLRVANALNRAGLPHLQLNLVATDPRHFSPIARGDEVFAYCPKNRPAEYGRAVLQKVRRRLPGLTFNVMRGAHQVAWPEGIVELLARSFIGLRLTAHDGAGCTAVEAGLMGRRTVHNSGTPFAIPWQNADDVVRAIEREQNGGCKRSPEEIATLTTGWIQSNPSWLEETRWL